MNAISAHLLVQVLRLLCPYLKEMAARTENEVDDKVVKFLCDLAGAGDTKTDA